MFSHSIFPTAVAVASIALGACSSGANTLTPTGEASISLSETPKRTTHAVKLGNLITIHLPPADGSTHAWHIAHHDGRYLKQTSEVVPPARADAAATITFIAARAGTTRLRFLLLPLAAGREADPIDVHELVLTIQ